jgi:hypothetical protein
MNWYLKPRKIEQNGKIYELLGIKTFVKFTPTEILARIQKKKKRRVFKSKKGLIKYFRDTLIGELAHVASLCILLIGSIVFVVKEFYFEAIILCIINVIINLYPIFLMRYNRIRIASVLKKSIPDLYQK